MNEPRDPATLRMAVACLGAALALTIVAIGLVLAFGPSRSVEHDHSAIRQRESRTGGKPKRRTSRVRTTGSRSQPTVGVPGGLWALAAGLAGALVGLLVPTPRVGRAAKGKNANATDGNDRRPPLSFTNISGFFAAGLLVLAIVAIWLSLLPDEVSEAARQSLIVAAATALFAIMIPTPARFDPE
ncbi:MAG TPA: hypothetical protein VMT37_08420 [Solirubrobacterales bacterium]|nr:hypothetical protein [Solirubrobacterales bacterium]